MRLAQKIIAAAGSAGLLLAQPAVAGPRSSDAVPSAGLKLANGSRVGSIHGRAERAASIPLVPLVFFIGDLVLLTVLITTDANPNSPG